MIFNYNPYHTLITKGSIYKYVSCLLKYRDKITDNPTPQNIAACTLESTHQDNCCCQASICTGIEPMDKSEQIDDFNFNISMNLCMKPPKNSDQAH